MAEKEIKSKEDFINQYADKIWDRASLINPETGRFYDEHIPILSALHHGIDRFIEAQDKYNTYQTALEEVKAGRKRTHWIWYIFPQQKGLGHSHNANYYGLDGEGEARAYIEHEILGERLRECCKALLLHKGKDIEYIMGSGVDVMKLNTSMNLFNRVSPNDVFEEVLDVFF